MNNRMVRRKLQCGARYVRVLKPIIFSDGYLFSYLTLAEPYVSSLSSSSHVALVLLWLTVHLSYVCPVISHYIIKDDTSAPQ